MKSLTLFKHRRKPRDFEIFSFSFGQTLERTLVQGLEGFLRGLMLDPFGQAREATAEQKRLRANYQKATSQIRETFHRVEDISIVHGAELVLKDSPAFKR
jgi:hypothetical protein